MNNTFTKGSEWRKWDLHIHSPFSILSNQFPKLGNGEPDWEPFLQKLESLEMAVLGITDYFTIEGYKAFKKFKEQGRLQNIYAILPNVEFRLKNIVSYRNGEEKRLNFHVIFSDEVHVEDIEEHFLHDIPFYYQGKPQRRDERRKLKISNLEALGKELMEQHAPFRRMGVSPLEIGATQAVVDHEEITDLLTTDSRFNGKYIIVLDAYDWDKINWDGQAHHLRQALLQKSDMVFSSNPKQRQWCLGENPYEEGVEHFLKEFKTLKPCIHGSDAHRVEDIGRPCAKRGDRNHNCDSDPSACELRYCWIKADPTFEGLKQVLYEPEERVQIQQNDPSPVISNYSITRIRVGGAVVNDELSLADTDFELNPFLVAVVGGKGAGKTALVDLVANCYVDRVATDDKNSFVKRVAEYKPQISTSLSFRDGGEFTKTLWEGKFYEDGQIIYIAQGELDKYIGEKSDLHKRIKELIFDSPQIKNSILSFDFDEAIITTEELEMKLDAKNQAIESLELKTSEDKIRTIEKEKTRIEADLKDIGQRIKELAEVQDESDTEAAEKKQEKLGALKSRHEGFSVLRSTLEKAIEFLEDQLSEFNRLIKVANELMKQLEIGVEEFPELSYSDKAKLEKVVGSIKTQIKQTVSEIEGNQKELEKLKFSVKKHAKLLERRRELQAELKAVEVRAKQLEEDKKNLQETEIERKKLMKELLVSVIAQKKQYEDIIKTFYDEKAEVLSDIDFVAEVRFDDVDFLKKAENILDNRKIVVMGDDKIPLAFDTLIKLARAVADGNESKVDKLIEEIERCNKEFKTKIKSVPVTSGHFYDLLYRNYMRVIPVVKYKKTYLEKLSLGQKATVLIKIYLAHGDKPIIIDSHDDHLDNEFIMEELVKAIRQAKSYRQVILVSNNGNVVVNSDAEQIVIANRHDGKITYLSGAIENPAIRDRALKVLEGGSEAFQKRQQKYRLGS
jgi:ABC-type Mn2+/Zn2+ transport system ATPase subunit